MNIAAPAPSHTKQDAANVRSDAYAAERISAQEAMKSMRISDSNHLDRRRKSNEIDEAYGVSRVDRYLASRAHSVRESSKPYDSRVTEKEAVLKALHAHAPERKRSKAGFTASHAITNSGSTRLSVPDTSSNAHNSGINNDQVMRHRQPHNVPQGSSTATCGHHSGSHTAPAATPQQFHNIKAPIPPQSSLDDNNDSFRAPATAAATTPITHQPTSGRQSRLSNVGSSKESYRRKYGDIQGYTYIGTIGQGNFGKVLLAENDITGEKVAVKILEKAQFKSEQQRLHATREARLMATLRHPNIVDVKTVMEDDYRILIVMENLTGGELFDYISNKGSLEEKEARRIFRQIVLAIHYCHENNVVHRDLKPENILLDSERNVRVADFGFGNNWHKDRHLTTYCGSPFYAAPEMVSGTPYIGPETDVWSLGVILYVLVCGRLPFDAGDLPALFAQIKRGNYQKPREGSIDVCSLIHRMLTVDPKRRATLADVLRSRWMRAEGMEAMATVLPALSTDPVTIRPSPAVRTQPQQHQQARSTGLATFHPNADISTTVTTTATAPKVNTNQRHNNHHYELQNHRHSYHPPGVNERKQTQQDSNTSFQAYNTKQQQQQHLIQTSYNMQESDQDDQMSDVSPSIASSPTETMATISPSTPVGPTLKDEEVFLTAVATAATGGVITSSTYQHHPYQYSKRTTMTTSNSSDDKHPHHPYKSHHHHHHHHQYQHHSRTSSVQTHAFGQTQSQQQQQQQAQQPPENVLINMGPSTEAIMDSLDTSMKKKRRALTKLRQFFRFETASKC
ncbi:NUAK SNF1-like kinase 1 [Mortierella sp. GBA30]|nr:NUAK SNF1-like kinase 1 [Mortierella sp. GBA30]